MSVINKIITFIFALFFFNLGAQNDPFITTWQVDANDQFTIPLQTGTYNFDFKWTLTTNTSIQIAGTHTNADGDLSTSFVFGGIYELEITGDFPHFGGYPNVKLLDVLQWGDIEWGNMSSMFRNWPGSGFAATDTPDLSQVTSLVAMFFGASNFDDDLDHWNVSNITSSKFMFRNATSFKGNISTWDVSNVVDMRGMFSGAASFNQDISGWDVGQVTDMREMLRNAAQFNQAIGNWDVRNVTTFREMFPNTTSFNQSLGGWQINGNADFLSIFNNNNVMDCQSWSSTILGWNFNNPTLNNMVIGGPNAEYDSLAAIAHDELVARGWTINGINIGGDCNAVAEFRCQDSVIVSNDTLFANLIITANDFIDVTDVVMQNPSSVVMSAPLVELNGEFDLPLGVELDILQAQGCP